MPGFQEWSCAVVSIELEGGNGWEAVVGSLALCSGWPLISRRLWLDLNIELVQWLVIGMKEVMVGSVALCSGCPLA